MFHLGHPAAPLHSTTVLALLLQVTQPTEVATTHSNKRPHYLLRLMLQLQLQTAVLVTLRSCGDLAAAAAACAPEPADEIRYLLQLDAALRAAAAPAGDAPALSGLLRGLLSS